MVMETAKSVLGTKKRNHQDWFDENNSAIEDLLAKKNKAFMEWQNDPGSISKTDRFKSLQAQTQQEIRKMHYKWWEKKADEVQHYADSNNPREFFSSIKSVFGPSKSGFAPLLSADGAMLIRDKAGINNRWKEYFSHLLNRSSSVDQSALEQIPQKPTLEDLGDPPFIDEVRKAIRQMSCGKASSKDGIPAELYKAFNEVSLKVFHNVLTSIWEEEEMP
uniref:Uncharacterized protein n=1 Tax=Pelodiscus sinensis TaxID=13735 RepID=K7EX84_PELSI